MLTPPIHARMDPSGDQVVEVTVDHGYRPQSIVARADVPLRMIFHREDDETCSERVVFSSPHLDRHLAPHGATTIVLPAQPAGEVRFTCAMGRYRGQIELRRDARPSFIERIRTVAFGASPRAS
jgi:plastocyanin domain-containing protein